MKNWLIRALCMFILFAWAAPAQAQETSIVLSDAQITVSGEAIADNAAAPVYLSLEAQAHEDVPAELKALQNRVVVISAAGTYRISGSAQDTQIAVRAGETDVVRLILDGVSITCRTAPAIAVLSAHDPRAAGEYGVTIELADGSENLITGSHTKAPEDDEDGLEYDGAIGSQVSLGFEGNGSLTVDADNEGIEVAFGHMTINGGTFTIAACDDPLNVAEDGFGTLTVNDGYVYSYVKPLEGGEGDGIDSNGYIVFNGGTVINLAHPASGDSGIDSDLGSTINGGVIVGAGNMYDPIDVSSSQLFMMLEFAEATNKLVVVTDESNTPVFAYDFPHDYMYIAFSTPALKEGNYRVYLGGEIEGTAVNGLYTDITAYTPGERMQHGEGTAQQRGRMGDPGDGHARDRMPMPQDGTQAFLPPKKPQDGTQAFLPPEGPQDGMQAFLPPEGPQDGTQAFLPPEGPQDGRHGGMGGGFGGPRSLESSSDTATDVFSLKKDSTGFTNVQKTQ